MTCRASVVFGYDWPRTCRRKCRPAYSSVIKLEATPRGERPVDLCHTTCYPPVILRNTGLQYLIGFERHDVYIMAYVIKRNNILSSIAQYNSQCPAITFVYRKLLMTGKIYKKVFFRKDFYAFVPNSVLPLTKRVLYRLRPSDFSFNFQYLPVSLCHPAAAYSFFAVFPLLLSFTIENTLSGASPTF